MALIDSLRPEFRPLARRIEAACDKEAAEHGLKAKVIQGYRTWEQQAKLYAQGRTTAGNIVTNAPPGTSWHNYGLAIDIGFFTMSGAYLGNHWLYNTVDDIVAAWKIKGLVVGTSFGDAPHYQFSGKYGAAVPTWVKNQYGRNPFALPIDIPSFDPVPPPPMPFTPDARQIDAFELLRSRGIYTEHTPKTQERYELATIMGRLLHSVGEIDHTPDEAQAAAFDRMLDAGIFTTYTPKTRKRYEEALIFGRILDAAKEAA